MVYMMHWLFLVGFVEPTVYKIQAIDPSIGFYGALLFASIIWFPILIFVCYWMEKTLDAKIGKDFLFHLERGLRQKEKVEKYESFIDQNENIEEEDPWYIETAKFLIKTVYTQRSL